MAQTVSTVAALAATLGAARAACQADDWALAAKLLAALGESGTGQLLSREDPSGKVYGWLHGSHWHTPERILETIRRLEEFLTAAG